MGAIAGQSTDVENAKPVPAVVTRDNDLKSSERGGLQAIANEDYRGQQHLSGQGGEAVTATIKRNVTQ